MQRLKNITFSKTKECKPNTAGIFKGGFPA